jgi:lipoprotein-anchoring transpeptidase ErfK/SrfK
MLRHRPVTVLSAERNRLAHLTHGSSTLGKYDAQMGEEVATNRKRAGAALIACVAVCAAGCGAHHERSAAPRPQRCHAGSLRALGSSSYAYAAVVRATARVFRAPCRRPITRFGRMNQNGVPTVLGVRAAVVRRDCRAGWYRVQLPIKPNGIVGYVRARDVDLGRVRTRIAVDLSARRLTFYCDGRPLLRIRVGIGSSSTPTPTGRFYVNQRFREDPSGPYGPAAIGISAYSNVLTWWAQGGPVAIHGTNRPETIGRAASNGCIHVPNRILLRLFRMTPAGTPVVIEA